MKKTPNLRAKTEVKIEDEGECKLLVKDLLTQLDTFEDKNR